MPTKSNGAVIRRLREQKGLTLTQLAEAAGISLTLMSRIEADKREGSPSTRLSLARVLGVNLDQITYFEPRTAQKQAA